MMIRRRVDGLRKDQKQAADDNEKEVKKQEGSEKEEVGEDCGAETSTQPFHG